MSEQQQVSEMDTDTQAPRDQQLTAFLAWFQGIEDRLILASLPVLVFCLILWAVAAAFPVLATVLNLLISILVILTSCIMLLRLVEIGWHWGKLSFEGDGVDPTPIVGTMGIAGLLIGGALALVDTVIHAGSASDSRTGLIVCLLLLLGLQYVAIIRRRLFSKEAVN